MNRSIDSSFLNALLNIYVLRTYTISGELTSTASIIYAMVSLFVPAFCALSFHRRYSSFRGVYVQVKGVLTNHSAYHNFPLSSLLLCGVNFFVFLWAVLLNIRVLQGEQSGMRHIGEAVKNYTLPEVHWFIDGILCANDFC